MRVAVVGAGIVGMALAAVLARRGADVTVIAAQEPDATLASHGWLNATLGNAPDYVRLRQFAIDAWRATELGPAAPLWCGSLSWEVEGADLDTFVTGHAALGYAIREVGCDEIRARIPMLADPPARAALAEAEGMVDAAAALEAFREQALAHGARTRTGEVQRLETGALAVAGRAIGAERIVVAAGTGARALLDVPVDAVPGLVVRARLPADASPLPQVLVAPGLMVAPAPDGTLILGGKAGGPAFLGDPAAAADRLLAEASDLLGGTDLRAVGWRLGQRPIPRDGHPIVGTMPDAPELYAAVTHSGVTLAPGIAELAADEILEGREAPLLAPYRPSRFAAP